MENLVAFVPANDYQLVNFFDLAISFKAVQDEEKKQDWDSKKLCSVVLDVGLRYGQRQVSMIPEFTEGHLSCSLHWLRAPAKTTPTASIVSKFIGNVLFSNWKRSRCLLLSFRVVYLTFNKIT